MQIYRDQYAMLVSLWGTPIWLPEIEEYTWPHFCSESTGNFSFLTKPNVENIAWFEINYYLASTKKFYSGMW